MVLAKDDLRRLEESMHIWFSRAQEDQILELLGTEPDKNAWSEQDIAEHVRHILRDIP